MPIVARTRFVAGRAVCDVRTYQIQRRDGSPSVRFSIGAVDGLDVASGDRTIDVIRAVRIEAERRVAWEAPQLLLELESAGACNTGQSLMGEILSPSDGSNRALLS